MGEAEQLKRELTRARSKLEEEKSIRGNIQVDFYHCVSLWMESHQIGLGQTGPLKIHQSVNLDDSHSELAVSPSLFWIFFRLISSSTRNECVSVWKAWTGSKLMLQKIMANCKHPAKDLCICLLALE